MNTEPKPKPWHPPTDVVWCVVRDEADTRIEVRTAKVGDECITLTATHKAQHSVARLSPERAQIIGRSLIAAANRAIARRT